MPGIPEEVLEEIRDRCDIVNVVSDYVNLKQAGRNYKALCPFHSEKTPSFNVNPDRQFYYCFGCGAGGNVFNFLMEIEGIGFVEAVKRVAERVGVKIEQVEASPQAAREKSLRERLYQINQITAEYYASCLRSVKARTARAYLARRGISPDMVKKFQLGYAPPGWENLASFLNRKGFSQEEGVSAGLLSPGKKGYYDRFRDRITFPICDDRGRIIAFGGRVIGSEEGPKYLNTPETKIFHKGKTLFALSQAKEVIRKSHRAIVVEGYTDVISLHQCGITNAVASLGTAFTERQARLLARFADTVYICFDGDAAGEAATWRGLDLLASIGLQVLVMRLPSGHDPDSFARERGKNGIIDLIAGALPLNEFKIATILSRHDISSVSGKVAAVEEFIPVLASMGNQVEREEYIHRVAEELNVSEYSLLAELGKYAAKQGNGGKFRTKLARNRYNKKDSARKQRKQFQSRGKPGGGQNSTLSAEEGLLKLMLNDVAAIDRVNRSLPLEYIRNSKMRQLATRLIELYRSGVDSSNIFSFLQGDLGALAAKICSKGELVPPVQSVADYMQRLRFGFLQEMLVGIEKDLSNAGPSELVTMLLQYKQLRDALIANNTDNLDKICRILTGRGERNGKQELKSG